MRRRLFKIDKTNCTVRFIKLRNRQQKLMQKDKRIMKKLRMPEVPVRSHPKAVIINKQCLFEQIYLNI